MKCICLLLQCQGIIPCLESGFDDGVGNSEQTRQASVKSTRQNQTSQARVCQVHLTNSNLTGAASQAITRVRS